MSDRRDLTVITNWRDSDHPESGGAELYCEEVARRLAARGRRVVILTSAVPGRPSREARDGYRIVRRGGRFGVYPAALAWLAVHRRRVTAVIDSQNGIPFFSPLVLRARTPVLLLIHHVHQTQFDAYFSPAMARVGRWLEGPATRRIYGRRTVVAVSPSTRRGVRQALKLKGSILIAAPGCEPPARAGRLFEERSATPRIVSVARMVPHKRVELAIKAMPMVLARHPDAELHLVGDGPERAGLENLAARVASGRVVFHGALSDSDRDAVVRSAWVAVNPSVGEGWGISVIEANSLGVPVVGFRVPGLRDSIRDGETGWLVEEGSNLSTALVEALNVLAEPSAATKWSDRVVARAVRADWDETTNVFDNLIQSEKGRLAHTERRQPSDLATHVHVPLHLIPLEWRPRFRLSDYAVEHGGGLSVLLPGTDLRDVPTALGRAGLPAAILRDPSLRVRLARPGDLVDPAGADIDAAGDAVGRRSHFDVAVMETRP